MLDDLDGDTFKRAREASAEESVNDDVVRMAGSGNLFPCVLPLAFRKREGRRCGARTGVEACEMADDLEVGARVSLCVFDTAKEYDIGVRAREPECACERRAVAAVVAAPAEDAHALTCQTLWQMCDEGFDDGCGG